MPKKYHITVQATPLNRDFVSKFKIVRGENCINCGKCTKVCIYEAHKRGAKDPRKIDEPHMALCKNCFRCIQECPRGALVKSLDPDFLALGGSYWKPDMFLSIWKQAEDGKVPVSGAGYRGPFTGPGFDGMWTDMSEIVRPTRDGIHGREYISTAVDLGRKLNHLTFDDTGNIVSNIHPTVDLPIPIIFDIPACTLSPNVTVALVMAAQAAGTFVIMPAAAITADIKKYADNIIPLVSHEKLTAHQAVISSARLVAIEYAPVLLNDFASVRESIRKISEAVTIVRVPAMTGIEDAVAKLARSGAEVIHIVADYCGREAPGLQQRFVKEVIRGVHLRLIDERIRDEVTIIISGGIAMAEHVPKAIICGADLTAVDIPLLIALGALLYEEPEMTVTLPDGLEKMSAATAARRIVNLMGAWHSQLLEVMGAMGIREVRRLRGETGRAIFFDEIDQDTFGKLFHQQEMTSI
jgi:ferredoxin